MHNKNQKNNHEQVTHHISSWLGMNNQGYREYLNTIVGAGQQDSLNIDHLKKHSNGIREAVAIYYRKLKTSANPSHRSRTCGKNAITSRHSLVGS